MKKLEKFGVAAIAAAIIPLIIVPAAADPVADFYRGRTITMMISSGVGGGYNAFSRTLSRHMGKHIPGNPKFINTNRVGAGGMVAANYAYNRSPKDGSVIVGINRAVPTQPLFGTKGAKYDATKFNWLGSLNNSVSVCVSWKTQKVKTLDDVFKTQLITGAQNASDMVTFPIMMNNLFGTKFRVIGGYASGTRVNLALERGEVQGRCGWSWASVKATRAHWIKDGSVNFLVQVALKRHKELPNLPLITDLVKNERDMQAVELILTRQEYGRPYMAPPGVPTARVEALRKAFMDTTKDPAFIKEIEKQRLELNPKSGWDMQKQIEKLYQTPKDVVAYAIEIQKKGVKKIKQIKAVYVKHIGKVVLIKRKGRRISIDYKGKKVKAKVSGSRTKVTVNGKKAKRKAIKMGMTCTFTYPGPGEEAKNIDCKG
jgi:tripartite-type tricarboxylate transporter receptor subunit TctC